MIGVAGMALNVWTIFQDTTLGLVSLIFNPHLPVDFVGINSQVRIGVALNDKKNGPTQADGQVPSLVAFNEKEWYIGASNWDKKHHVGSAGYVDVVVHQEDMGPGQEPAYLQVLGHDDAVCVAYIAQTWPDGQQRGWMGDMGRACGKRWFFSNLEVGEEKYKPDCTWLDRDHARDGTDVIEANEAAAIQINMQAFTNLTSTHPIDPSFYCTAPTLLFVRDYSYNDTLDTWTESTVPARSRVGLWTPDHGFKRQLPAAAQPAKNRSPALRSKLVSSPHEKHSASALCASETSHGPDFASHAEGLFCDMGTKTLWPFCAEGKRDMGGCYDWGNHSLVLEEGGTEERGYAHVEEWV